jgi:hypothetical protein
MFMTMLIAVLKPGDGMVVMAMASTMVETMGLEWWFWMEQLVRNGVGTTGVGMAVLDGTGMATVGIFK